MKRARLRAAAAWLLVGAMACVHTEQLSRDAADLIIEKLAVRPGDQVADIGAGDGAIAFRLAEAVGPNGRVYAAEISPARLEKLKVSASEALHHNVEVVSASEADPNLPQAVDLIVLRHVYHHLEDRIAYFTNVRRYLHPEGRLVIIELDDIPWYTFHGAHRTDAATVKRELGAAAYRLEAEYHNLKHERLLVFSSSH